MSSEDHSKTSDLVRANKFDNIASNMRFADVQKLFERADRVLEALSNVFMAYERGKKKPFYF